ncbi:hypothetical protein [Catellatospora paridis]|uniref:hypothetical protein n=1 Tax=Catellatospora paridis TaxID=1617086 RepID=UPI0012D3BAA8|nr:hypothetical protein [Catellatospora paridis]
MQTFTSRALVALSIVYGATIAILAITGSDHVGKFAAIGGITIGVLWALRAVLGSGSNQE